MSESRRFKKVLVCIKNQIKEGFRTTKHQRNHYQNNKSNKIFRGKQQAHFIDIIRF